MTTSKQTRINETKMAEVVTTILRRRPKGSATFAELREQVPRHLRLSRADRVQSPTRPGEELWEQILRNLKAHQHEGFVGVPGGIRLASTQLRRKAA